MPLTMHKVAALPNPLIEDSIYMVESATAGKFTMYIVNSGGTIAFQEHVNIDILDGFTLDPDDDTLLHEGESVHSYYPTVEW